MPLSGNERVSATGEHTLLRNCRSKSYWSAAASSEDHAPPFSSFHSITTVRSFPQFFSPRHETKSEKFARVLQVPQCRNAISRDFSLMIKQERARYKTLHQYTTSPRSAGNGGVSLVPATERNKRSVDTVKQRSLWFAEPRQDSRACTPVVTS